MNEERWTRISVSLIVHRSAFIVLFSVFSVASVVSLPIYIPRAKNPPSTMIVSPLVKLAEGLAR